jgi:hypothetical protein
MNSAARAEERDFQLVDLSHSTAFVKILKFVNYRGIEIEFESCILLLAEQQMQ